MQFSIVILLIIISFQAVRAFQVRAFYTVATAWVLNLLYLLATELGPKIFGHYLDSLAYVFDFATTALFWYVAHQYGRSQHWMYFQRLSKGRFIAFISGTYILFVVLSATLPIERYGIFFLTSMPDVMFDMCALSALAYYFREVANSVCAPQLPTFHLLYRATLFYAWIQLFQLFAHETINRYLHIDVASIGFAAGFIAKIGIVLGIIGLFVRSAETLIQSSVERKSNQLLTSAIDRLAHELGTPISETLNHVISLRVVKPSEVSLKLGKVEGSAARAAAILGASRFGFDPATSTISFRDSDGTWGPETLSKSQVHNLNTLVEIAENAVRSTRSEDVEYHHQYSGRCCVECVPNEIIQILINIFRNAHDAFLNQVGRIDIFTTNESSAMTGRPEWPKGGVKLVIRDNGEGIKEENKQGIFKEGYSTRAGPGRGFGLAVVKKLVEKNAGMIEIVSPSRSKGNIGTEVILVFPRVSCLQR